MRRLIYFTLISTFISCDSSKHNNDDDSTTKDTVAKGEATNFEKGDEFAILSFKETHDYPSSETDTTICETWTLNVKDIEKIIKESETISGPDWHHLFDHLPCSITGQLKQTNRTYGFQLNAGSWLTVMNNDTTIYFGYFKQDGDKLFMSTPVNLEDEE